MDEEWLIVDEITPEEADEISEGKTPYRIDEKILQHFRPLYNNNLMTVQHMEKYFLTVHRI